MEMTLSILGLGNIGKQVLASLLSLKQYRFIINIVEISDECKGAFLDFQHAAELSPHTLMYNSTDHFNQSDYIFHCAGASVPKGKSRLYTTNSTIEITEAIFANYTPQREARIIVIANPVEIISHVTHQVTGLPAHCVIGTGTLLDSLRMNHYTKASHPHLEAVDFVLLGEHGSSVFVSDQLSTINGAPQTHSLSEEELEQLLIEVKGAAHKIKATQGATIYGVTFCAIKMFEDLLQDTPTSYAVSAQMPDDLCRELGVSPMYLSLFADLSSRGCLVNGDYRPNAEELKLIKASYDQISAYIPKTYLPT